MFNWKVAAYAGLGIFGFVILIGGLAVLSHVFDSLLGWAWGAAAYFGLVGLVIIVAAGLIAKSKPSPIAPAESDDG